MLLVACRGHLSSHQSNIFRLPTSFLPPFTVDFRQNYTLVATSHKPNIVFLIYFVTSRGAFYVLWKVEKTETCSHIGGQSDLLHLLYLFSDHLQISGVFSLTVYPIAFVTRSWFFLAPFPQQRHIRNPMIRAGSRWFCYMVFIGPKCFFLCLHTW